MAVAKHLCSLCLKNQLLRADLFKNTSAGLTRKFSCPYGTSVSAGYHRNKSFHRNDISSGQTKDTQPCFQKSIFRNNLGHGRCFKFNGVNKQKLSTSLPMLSSWTSDKSSLVKQHHQLPPCRHLSWTSWLTSRKHNPQIIDKPGKVSPTRPVPDHIPKPLYVLSGIIPPDEAEIEIKSEDQIARMRESCRVAREVLEVTSEAVKVGITTDELDAIAHDTALSLGAYPSPLLYKGFPKSICTSVNNVACHGIPDDRTLQNGDILNIDVTVYYNGYHGDLSATFGVGEIEPSKQRLIEVAEFCRDAAIEICKPGVEFNNIGAVISAISEEAGYNVVAPFCGHGIGQTFHAPPAIYHFENSGTGTMEEGMTFTIEPIIAEGDSEIMVLPDKWTAVTRDNSWSAQFEHTILITKDGVEILTGP